MKKSLLAAASAFALLLFASCSKHGLIPPGNTIDYCHITTITDTDYTNRIDSLTFYYNPDGSPSHIVASNPGDNSPNYVFRYDSQGRLLDYIAAYANGAAISWIRYYYDEATRTVTDTGYTLATQYLIWPPTYFGDATSEVKHYDELGRIISYEQFVFENVNGVDSSVLFYSRTYTYNREGNVEGGQYDNKINLHRTNRVWQFIDNDYNNNNVLPVHQYNAYGLPSEIPINPSNTFLFSLEFQTLNIHYSCDAPLRK
jgi:hypothetical protein